MNNHDGNQDTILERTRGMWLARRSEIESEYLSGRSSFLRGLTPPDALELPVESVLDLLVNRYGDVVNRALNPVEAPSPLPRPDTSWITRAKFVGINVRTIGSFWRVVHYTLTLPSSINSVHLLPIWEPGVVGSLYGMASWQINDEFFDEELARVVPSLDTVQKQLRATVAILHATGRSVGMDVIPHTDRFSEMALAQPWLFEWLRRDHQEIVDHRADLHTRVEALIHEFLTQNGPATAPVNSSDDAIPGKETLFAGLDEDQRSRLLFGEPSDRAGRNNRRGQIIRYVHRRGYEPVPATMGPPYRGIEIVPGSGSGEPEESWVDYRITKPESMSRVFGPLTRYKLFDRINDNRDWMIDFESPRRQVWDYLASHYSDTQRQYGFDFMRGDMSHVQMRPDGVPALTPEFYDPLEAVKERVQTRVPSFAYFAESFLAPPGVMAYGDEVDHLESSRAEVTLGDLQSVPVSSNEYSQRLRQYLDIACCRRVVPCLTVMTADKDDPRFDEYYLDGNEARLFLGLFVPDMPSYVGLGFELRDRHAKPASNEHYSKLYVFQVSTGKHRTTGPYRFGQNRELFDRLGRVYDLSEQLLPQLENPRWLLHPDPTAGRKSISWACDLTQGDKTAIFVVNLDTVAPACNVRIPTGTTAPEVELLFTTVPDQTQTGTVPGSNGFNLDRLGRGEGRVYLSSNT